MALPKIYRNHRIQPETPNPFSPGIALHLLVLAYLIIGRVTTQTHHLLEKNPVGGGYHGAGGVSFRQQLGGSYLRPPYLFSANAGRWPHRRRFLTNR